MEYISERPDLTFDMIKANLHLEWFEFGSIYCNDRITDRIIFCNPEINWDFRSLSPTKGISIDYIDANIHKPWDFSYICDRDDLTPEVIIKHIDRFTEFNGLSLNPKITTDIIDMFPDKPWNYGYLTLNPNIAIEYIAKHPEKRWDYKNLLHHSKLKLKFEVNFSYLRNSLHISHILPHTYKLDFEECSKHPNITLDIISKWTKKHHPDSHVWKYLTHNPNITIQFIADNIDKAWNFRKISQNKNFMYDNYKKDMILEIKVSHFIINDIKRCIIEYI